MNGLIHLPEATRRRIDKALETLDYRPNPHARRLSTGRTETLGLVVPDIANPFFARIAAAAETAADARGLHLSLFSTRNRPQNERLHIESLSRKHFDGLIFATNHAQHGDLPALADGAGPLVLIDEDVPGANAPRLFCDNRAGGALAAAHLVELGHTTAAYFGAGPELMSGRRRFEGFRDELTKHGARLSAAYYCDYTRDGGRAAASAFIEDGRPASAVFAAADEIAIGALEIFAAAGLRIPRDLSLIGFDDVAPLHLFDPALTAVRQPVDAFGRRAVEILTAPQGVTPWGEELLPVTLERRASCAAPTGPQPTTTDQQMERRV
jgi:LacI family transcriptional regulator